MQKFKQTGGLRYIHQNERDEDVFNMTWLMKILNL